MKKIFFVFFAFLALAVPSTNASQGMERAISGIQPTESIALLFLQDFTSRQALQRAGQRAVEGAVRKSYPDCQGLASMDPRRSVGI